MVPGDWATSLTHALRTLELRKDCQPTYLRQMLALVQFLSIVPDPSAPAWSLLNDFDCASSYDVPPRHAPYLALCLRTGLPLAAIDPDLRRHAMRRGVDLYDPSLGDGVVTASGKVEPVSKPRRRQKVHAYQHEGPGTLSP
jgi:hypothetical protein